ncbi:Hypothetical protein D9617_1g084140 [Elsinoe fawcettii]|nr:Hypothetical protein D9617_1g084140 [Elsinoe fawcettii]
MPLWTVYHSPNALVEDEARAAFTKDVTAMYTGIGLPAFYVVVVFIETAHRSLWVGAEKRTDATPFVRAVIEHIAVRLDDDDKVYKRTSLGINQVFEKNIRPTGADWEFHVDETERRLWMVNGIFPPGFGSEEEKAWVKANKALTRQESGQAAHEGSSVL